MSPRISRHHRSIPLDLTGMRGPLVRAFLPEELARTESSSSLSLLRVHTHLPAHVAAPPGASESVASSPRLQIGVPTTSLFVPYSTAAVSTEFGEKRESAIIGLALHYCRGPVVLPGSLARWCRVYATTSGGAEDDRPAVNCSPEIWTGAESHPFHGLRASHRHCQYDFGTCSRLRLLTA
jgi:hypothetical protein